MQNVLVGYSKALYATWFYYKPARLLLDAGEGIVHVLGKRIFGIRKVFLSHGHEDHIAGLPSLVNLRNLSNGDREIPIEVHHPAGDPFIRYLKEYLGKKQDQRLRYNLSWHPLDAGDTVPVEIARRPVRVAAFPVAHTRGWQSLGYRIEEQRQVLRPEFAEADPREVGALIAERGRAAVVEEVWHPLLVYTGDCTPPEDPSPYRGADVLLVDSTFLDAGDLEESRQRHGHIDASLRLAAEAGVRHLVLIHLSNRHSRRAVLEAVDRAAERHGRPPRLGYFYEDRYYALRGAAD
jgi:ribonuclease Z